MSHDPTGMTYRDPMALLRFALRERDLRLVELLARALKREAVPPRATGAPSPLARRTLDALLVLLGTDQPSGCRRRGSDE
jgi:hypothetical protein